MYQTSKKNKAGKNTLFKCLVRKREKKPVTLRQFWDRRNKVMIRRRIGGLGDIIMHRMIFADFRRIFPEIDLTFTCPKEYVEIIEDHPHLNDVYDYTFSKTEDYGIVYDTTTRCRVYEAIVRPCPVHRSDIWAGSCGVTLQSHEMHIHVTDSYIKEARKLIGDKKSVLFVPFTNNGFEKNLLHWQAKEVILGLQSRGYTVVGLHAEQPALFDEMGCVSIVTRCLKTFRAVIAAVDYVVTIDTAAFHLAGGMKKPMVGIFSWTDGKVYGKYYDFTLVQKHRDHEAGWCGPCACWMTCPKVPYTTVKPCVSELNPQEILNGFDLLTGRRAISFSLPVIR